FFYSDPFRWRGYSGAIGLDDDGMSFELGIGQLIVLPLVFIFFGNFEKLRKSVDSRLLTVGTATFAGWLMTLAYMLYPHLFLKVLPKQFAYIQFPWRVLGITAFLGAASIAVFCFFLKSNRYMKPLLVAASLLVLLLVPNYQCEANLKSEWSKR